MKSYAVIGLGRFGKQVAARLYEYGEDVLAIDIREDPVNEIASQVTRAVTADARDKEVLRKLGVQNCDCAIVAMGTNLASSVLITMNLKTLGVGHIICKAHDDTHREILNKLGADEVIIPERVVADKTAGMLASPNILEHIELSSDFGIVEYKTPKSWVGKTIREIGIRTRYDVNLLAVKEGEKIEISLRPDRKFTEDAILVLLGSYDRLWEIRDLR